MTEPKNQPIFHINQVGNLNTGDVTNQRDQIGIQHNYAADPEVKSVIAELQTLFAQLQTQHPQITTQPQALPILDAEFTEIKQGKTPKLAALRQQLFNPERHLQALKAALGEIAKHYLEQSVLGKNDDRLSR